MANWNLFAGAAILLTVSLLVLAKATAETLSPPDRGDVAAAATTRDQAERSLQTPLDDRALLVNAAVSHGVFGAILVAVAWYARIPASVLGTAVTGRSVLLGVGLGLGLAVANEGGGRLADRLGFDADEGLRELLAPDSLRGWALLLVVVLPTIAFVEELLFRAALIGGLAAGYGIPIWLLAVASSVAFGLGHGLQGAGGVIVTTLLGLVLATAYVATGSLLVVVVAHYLVNAIEFVVHEGLEGRLARRG